LAEIGRDIMEEQLSRPADQRFKRWLIRKVLPYPHRFGFLLRLGQLFRSFLPRDLKAQVPVRQITRPRPSQQHSRQMLVLEGCAQLSATPNTNSAAARVLDKLGISLIAAPDAGCCGAVSYHMPAHEEGLAFMRRNINVWWPYIEAGAESIVISASGCGSMVKEYGEKLKHDDAYAAKAKRISALTRDLSEILIKEDLEKLVVKQTNRKTAVHCPCSLQHAQQLGGHVEQILQRAGIELSKTQNGHLCCGSAGTYSLLQPKLSQQLLTNKITDLTIENPDQIVTANIGCQLHLGSHASVPVKHWIELLDP
jgi:glycolate oxidase iron-sulfur subunit